MNKPIPKVAPCPFSFLPLSLLPPPEEITDVPFVTTDWSACSEFYTNGMVNMQSFLGGGLAYFTQNNYFETLLRLAVPLDHSFLFIAE